MSSRPGRSPRPTDGSCLILTPIAHDHPISHTHQHIVQPLRLGTFLEGEKGDESKLRPRARVTLVPAVAQLP